MKTMDPIPMDLLFEILLRLPVKSVARFVCVSKLWQKTIRSDEFIRSYSLRSSSNQLPRLLRAFNRTSSEHWYFFTKSVHALTPPVTRDLYLDLPRPHEPSQFATLSSKFHWPSGKPSYAHGLISYLYGKDQLILNPSIGKYVTLPVPPIETDDTYINRCFLGYDPINVQYKVLLCSSRPIRSCYHQVLTLGAQNYSWSFIQCSTPHRPGTRHVCIEGVLYYYAFPGDSMKEGFLMRFDVRSEILEVVSAIPESADWSNIACFMHLRSSLINYHGKLAAVYRNKDQFDIWVLEDAKQQKWSNERLTFPQSSIRSGELEILGTSDTGEIGFLSICRVGDAVYFLDQKSNRIRKVMLEGRSNYKLAFLDYVESVMFV